MCVKNGLTYIDMCELPNFGNKNKKGDGEHLSEEEMEDNYDD